MAVQVTLTAIVDAPSFPLIKRLKCAKQLLETILFDVIDRIVVQKSNSRDKDVPGLSYKYLAVGSGSFKKASQESGNAPNEQWRFTTVAHL